MPTDLANEEALNVLLELACPSIRYRIRSEILSVPDDEEGMLDLRRQILQDRLVKDVIAWQQSDGWLGNTFHGYGGTEAGIRILCEKGVRIEQPVLKNALNALENADVRLQQGIGKVGLILDQMKLGGSQMIRAALFAEAGIEDRSFIQDQIDLALAAFRAVLSIQSINELTEVYRGEMVLRPNLLWPGIYHLRLLARTQDWRTPENGIMIAKSLATLVKWSPLTGYHIKYRNQVIAPASFCMDHFNPDLDTMDSAHWMMWFHRMELLARLGVIPLVPELSRQVAALEKILEAENGFFKKKMDHPYFRKWGAYTGLMLEKDWINPQRKINDLTFRCLLIRHDSRNPVIDKIG